MAIFGRGYNLTFDGNTTVEEVSDDASGIKDVPITKSDNGLLSTLKIWAVIGLILGGFILSGNIKKEYAAENTAAYNGAAAVERIISDAD